MAVKSGYFASSPRCLSQRSSSCSLEIVIEVIIEVLIVVLLLLVRIIVLLLLLLLLLLLHQADSPRHALHLALSNDFYALIITIIVFIPAIVGCLLCAVLKVSTLIILEASVTLLHCILQEAYFHGCFVSLELNVTKFVEVSLSIIHIAHINSFLLFDTTR